MELRPHQKLAISKMRNGCVLYGGVGTGKTHTVLGYYERYEAPKDIVVITTARKRDSFDWEETAAHFKIFPDRDVTKYGTITVDSWNNINKYVGVENAFFVFDEQRVVGSGSWVKAFLKITKRNHWVLLSGTPGDSWVDYIPVFVANGMYKNRSEFLREHVVYKPFIKFPVIDKFVNEHKLEMMRNYLLVEMPYEKHTKLVLNWMDVDYDRAMFNQIVKSRWNPFEERPLTDVADMYRVLRRITNTDPSRLDLVKRLKASHERLIVWYNFDYELDILRTLSDTTNVFEYNGHKKQHYPETGEWIYLVQYIAGAEAWNCTVTDAMAFYSLTYSWRNWQQAMGRTDRLNTPFIYLYYYMFMSDSNVDQNIRRALDNKEDFNERKDAQRMGLVDSKGNWL